MKKRSMIVGGIVCGLFLAVATQMSVVRLGDDTNGSTVVVFRTGSLDKLRPFYDSSKAVCERMGPQARVFGSTFMCEGSLAIAIMEEDRALIRFNRSSSE